MYIANQESLEAFVERARSSSVLAIDTEFLREKTYYAKLCLLQLATDDEATWACWSRCLRTRAS